MKQGAALVMVLAVLLFSQSALAEIEFQPGELMAMDEIEDQGLPSGPLAASPTIVPLQIYTHPYVERCRSRQPLGKPRPGILHNRRGCVHSVPVTFLRQSL